MANIFQDIKGTKYNRPVQSVLTSKVPNEVKSDAFSKWQADKSSQSTKILMQQLKPTIESALHTYVPGQQDQFRLKASAMALHSLTNYTPAKGASPNTYIFTQLQRLTRVRRQRQNPIHIPESQVFFRQAVDKKSAQLQDQLGREPSLAQLSDYTKISQKKLQQLFQDKGTVNDSATQNQSGGMTQGIAGVTDKDYYDYVYGSVSPVDQKIMQWSSGFGKTPLSNNQIAAKLKISPGAVSQHKAKIQQLLSEVRGLV